MMDENQLLWLTISETQSAGVVFRVWDQGVCFQGSGSLWEADSTRNRCVSFLLGLA